MRTPAEVQPSTVLHDWFYGSSFSTVGAAWRKDHLRIDWTRLRGLRRGASIWASWWNRRAAAENVYARISQCSCCASAAPDLRPGGECCLTMHAPCPSDPHSPGSFAPVLVLYNAGVTRSQHTLSPACDGRRFILSKRSLSLSRRPATRARHPAAAHPVTPCRPCVNTSTHLLTGPQLPTTVCLHRIGRLEEMLNTVAVLAALSLLSRPARANFDISELRNLVFSADSAVAFDVAATGTASSSSSATAFSTSTSSSSATAGALAQARNTEVEAASGEVAASDDLEKQDLIPVGIFRRACDCTTVDSVVCMRPSPTLISRVR